MILKSSLYSTIIILLLGLFNNIKAGENYLNQEIIDGVMTSTAADTLYTYFDFKEESSINIPLDLPAYNTKRKLYSWNGTNSGLNYSSTRYTLYDSCYVIPKRSNLMPSKYLLEESSYTQYVRVFSIVSKYYIWDLDSISPYTEPITHRQNLIEVYFINQENMIDKEAIKQLNKQLVDVTVQLVKEKVTNLVKETTKNKNWLQDVQLKRLW